MSGDTRLSLEKIVVRSSQSISVGEHVALCIDQLGVVRGEVTQLLELGFLIALAGDTRECADFAERVTRWQTTQKRHLLPERRREPRVRLDNLDLEVVCAAGTPVKILNLSATGAEIGTTERALVGSNPRIGRMSAQIVRHSDKGLGVMSVDARQSLGARFAEIGLDLNRICGVTIGAS